jgi:hypothetical protein
MQYQGIDDKMHSRSIRDITKLSTQIKKEICGMNKRAMGILKRPAKKNVIAYT